MVYLVLFLIKWFNYIFFWCDELCSGIVEWIFMIFLILNKLGSNLKCIYDYLWFELMLVNFMIFFLWVLELKFFELEIRIEECCVFDIRLCVSEVYMYSVLNGS